MLGTQHLHAELRRADWGIKLFGAQLITGLRKAGLARAFYWTDTGTDMLRITVQEDGALWRLQLAGRLEGPWVAETENTWRSAPASSRRVVIDIREVTWIDQAGLRLLHAMNQAGARFVATGVAMEALVEEVTGKPARRRRA
ncbi:MAG: uncharacterized protein JWO80_4529 [Bryobacterales bacterium]|nr:uncharacterized protein [Bryobacterales bacterium]